MKLRLGVGFRRWGTRANWLSELRNDIDLRKMASEKKPRSANCRHVPEASELNGENGCCLEVLKQTVLPGRTKVQLDRGLLAALLPEAQLSLCASGPVLCGSRVTEHSQRPRCPVDGSSPRRLVTPRVTCGTAGNGRQGVWEQQQLEEGEAPTR